MLRISNIILCVCLAASVALGQESSPAKSNAQRIAGTWVLHQFDSIASLQKATPAIEKALTDFDTVGFCLR